jgi:hypothetical protein
MTTGPMRFTIEQRHLTDVNGKPVPESAALSFHVCDASDADDAVTLFVRNNSGEVIGAVLKFPGFQAVATVRNPEGVFTLQVSPASQQMTLT